MLCRAPIFILLTAAMTFAAGGVNITVNASVDSHIKSVTVKSGSQSLTLNKDQSLPWQGWVADSAYSVTATDVDTGYTPRWRVSTNNVEALSGGTNNTIILPNTSRPGHPAQDFSGCALLFYGEPKQYTVTLNPQSGSGGTPSVTATYYAAMPTATMPTRTGYSFGGYYKETGGGGKQYYTAEGTSARNWKIPSNTTLYAQWTANTYTVTLDQQSGSGGTTSVTATYDADMPTVTMPTRDGFTFGGYYTAVNGGGTQYYDESGASARNWDKANDTTTLYAKWTAASFIVTLDRQGGSGGTESVTATYGRALSSIQKPTRGGFKFGGYFAEANGGGTQYYTATGSARVNSPFTSNTTIYAYWIQNPTVTFELNGGSFKSGSGWTTVTNYEDGVGLTLPTGSDVTFANHAFNGWYEYGSTDRIMSIGPTATGNKTFYAQWKDEFYYVTFDANDGSNRSGEQEMSMVNTVWLKPVSELFARSGYAFAAWNAAMDGSGDSYVDHAEISTANSLTNVPSARVTLYAQWTPNQYEVAFHPNGADGGETMDNQSFVYDVTQRLDAVEFTYTGRAFERWSSDTNYTYQTKYYPDGAEVVNLTALSNDVVNLYANWTGIVYTVSFDANGGVGAMNPLPCTYGVPTNLPACAFTRNGYGFKGWTTNGVDGVLFNDRARVTNLTATAGAEVPLIACWTGVTYAVTLDARDWRGDGMMTNCTGETVSVLTNLYTVGDNWILPVPTNVRPHLAFAGWKDNWGRMVDDGIQVPLDSEGVTNLVAVWSDSLAAAVDAPRMEFTTFGTEGDHGRPNESPYPAAWFAQANFVYGSTNAVQSGNVLPAVAGDSQYASWLVTKVEGRGVLSFWWKCDARPLEFVDDPVQDWVGDTFRFGLYDSAGGITNELARLTEHVDWCPVVYTNKSDSVVALAWKFIYADYGENNGGGTGWVDRVTWTPEGSVGTLLSISIAGDESVRPGDSAAYTCTAMMSDGSMKSVTPTWSIESGASDADLDSSGVLTAHATDVLRTVSIKASYAEDGVTVTATKTVTIAPLNTYTITFDPNGGSGTMAPQTCICDVATNLPACAFTRDGWGFAGWATNGTDGVLFADGARVLNLVAEGSVALYACWTGVTYAVTLDANGGVLMNGSGEPVEELAISVTVGGVWDLPVPTRTDTSFVFGGWTDGEGQKVSSGDEVPPPSAGITRLVATWTKADPLAIAVDAPELGFGTFGTVGYSLELGQGEEAHPADWSVQSDVCHMGASAVQSGSLPSNTGEGDVHISWLTTTVEGKGVLSFWWKCDAKPMEFEPNQRATDGWAGDLFRFVLYDSAKGITNEVARLTNHVDWCKVVYTNKSDSAVSFAWAYVYADYGYANGGGTGWVDHVTWTPEGSVTADVTPTHGVPYSWLREKFSGYASADADALEALAEGASNGKAWPNGTPVKVWEDYWAGTDPNDADDIFHALIAVTNGVPTITWRPDMREAEPPRVYRVLCAPTPSAHSEEWVVWPGPGTEGAATNRFFKVELDVEGSRQK